METNPPEFRHDSVERVGILLTNLGTPDDPNPSAVRRYLAEFLWDKRVIDYPRPLWWLILHGIILRFRPRKVSAAYRSIWTDQGSPLLANTLAQAQGVAERLNTKYGDQIRVEAAMRYGKPSIAQALERLRSNNVRRILVLPMYPQYSGTTTASVFDGVAKALETWNWIPQLRFVNDYHDHPGYIHSLAASIREYWNKHGCAERLLFSFHGIPKRYLLEGDPYHCQCYKTARLVADSLQLADEDWFLSFQSRLGREEWLRPYTDEVLTQYGEHGPKKVDVICPGFSSDCLETLEEMAIRNLKDFQNAGGIELNYIPALNARTEHIDFLLQLIESECATWPEFSENYDAKINNRQAEQTKRRALALGAST